MATNYGSSAMLQRNTISSSEINGEHNVSCYHSNGKLKSINFAVLILLNNSFYYIFIGIQYGAYRSQQTH